MSTIINPILRGFNPDPSIIRVGDDYYIATSTFEWWPGVQIHHSRDLRHWELLCRPLADPSRVDLRGVGASQGIWAPDLSYSDGVFYLVYTVVSAFYCNMYDTHNYLITARDIGGPWSEPVALSNFGFDPSLFHDWDGRKYMVSMVTDHRVPKKYAGRLIAQEYDPQVQKLVGERHEVYHGETIFLEGPHLMRHGDWYYLFCADTGTGELHGQSILRSKNVYGPYEMYKADFMRRDSESEACSILTSRHHPELKLQKAGHASLVETQSGEWYIAHLCSRATDRTNPSDAPRFAGARRYMLGRETALQKVVWTEDGWLRLAGGGALPQDVVEAPELPDAPFPALPSRETFDAPSLRSVWQTLRVPLDERAVSLTARPGYLRLVGGNGLGSRFQQTLLAQRVTEYHARIQTCVTFAPKVYKQMAGLLLWYDNDNYVYLHVTHDEELGRVIALLKAENKRYAYPAGFISLPGEGPVHLRAELNGADVQFSYSLADETHFVPCGPNLDASFLSDEACQEGWFTGLMTGIACQDLTGDGAAADFTYFELDAWEAEP